jgi:hypothetical protein
VWQKLFYNDYSSLGEGIVMKKSKKALATIIAAATLTVPSVASAQDLTQKYYPTDIQGSWAYTQLNDLVHADFLHGYNDASGHFGMHPTANMTRAEFAQLLCSVIGEQELKNFYQQPKEFVDVKKGDWYYNAVHVLASIGFISGVDQDHFEPNRPIHRDEIARLVYSSFQITSNDNQYTPRHFLDVSDTYWAKHAIDMLSARHIINGYNGLFRPHDTATRAEAATVMYNTLHLYTDFTPPPSSQFSQEYAQFVKEEEDEAMQLMQAGNFQGLYEHNSIYESGLLKALNDAETTSMLAEIAAGNKIIVTQDAPPQYTVVAKSDFSGIVEATNAWYQVTVQDANGNTLHREKVNASGRYSIVRMGLTKKLYDFQPSTLK